MLAGLDDIPWSKLEHAYGSAEDVPGLIRQLLAHDPKVRSDTMWTLYGNVFHQGTRYPATPYVIPFLIELCSSPQVDDRWELLRFWGSLITGYFNVQERPLWSDGTHIYGYGEPQDIDPTDPYATALQEIYINSLAGEGLLFDLLSDNDTGIRTGAVWILACLPTISERSIPALRMQMHREQSGWARAAIAFALGELGDAATVETLMNFDDHPAVQCMAACQLARIAPKDSLIEPLLRFVEEPIEGYENIPGAGGDSAGDAAFSITNLPIATRRMAIPAICDRLDLARSFATMPFTIALLSAAFEPRVGELTEFTNVQRQVLLRMLNTQELWSIGNLSGSFRMYGLPHDREKCARLLGVRVTNDDALAALSIAVTFADMGFLDKAREGIERAISLDASVFARIPEPDECWLFCAKAFAETDAERAIQAFRNACAINPNIIHRIGVTWRLADLLHDSSSE